MNGESQPRLKQRDPWLDNVKGLLMILVVMGHISYPLVWNSRAAGWLYDYINFFHMCAFMVLSGFLARRRVEEKDFPAVINKLLLPYLACQLMFYLFAAFIPGGMKQIRCTLKTLSFTTPIYHLWYIYALVLFHAVAMVLQPQRRPVLSMVLALGVSLAVGLFFSVQFMQLTRLAGMFPMFLLGLLLPREFVTVKLRKRSFRRAVAGAAVLVGVFALFYIPSYRHRWIHEDAFSMCVSYQSLYPENPVLPGLAIRAGMLLAGPLMLWAIGSLMPGKRCILTRLGERSIYIYILHAFLVIATRPSGLAYKGGYSIPGKLLTVAVALILPFLLVTDPVRRVFHRILEPTWDYRNLFRKDN